MSVDPNRPPILKNIDWEAVKQSAIAYVQEVEDAKGDEINSDVEHYIFERVISAVYGKDIWDHVNSIQ